MAENAAKATKEAAVHWLRLVLELWVMKPDEEKTAILGYNQADPIGAENDFCIFHATHNMTPTYIRSPGITPFAKLFGRLYHFLEHFSK